MESRGEEDWGSAEDTNNRCLIARLRQDRTVIFCTSVAQCFDGVIITWE